MIYRVWCKFEPEYVNPLTGRRGRWRVTGWQPRSLYQIDQEKFIMTCFGELYCVSLTPERPGTIINPAKELRRVLEAAN